MVHDVLLHKQAEIECVDTPLTTTIVLMSRAISARHDKALRQTHRMLKRKAGSNGFPNVDEDVTVDTQDEESYGTWKEEYRLQAG